MAARSLAEWLDHIESIHPSAIDLGLDRLRRVAGRAGLLEPSMPIVIVAGTNGKGSTVAMLEAAWCEGGYRIGASTSPHLHAFNERVRVSGRPLDDAALVTAFQAVAPFVAPDTLTYFEYTTLAAMRAFVDACCDVVVLEVGLGGRLDASNLWNADVAVLTSVALDHADWLGTDLDVIATEKAAVARRGRPLVVGEPSPPVSLGKFAREHGIELIPVSATDAPATLGLPGEHQRRNAACALAVVRLLAGRLPMNEPDARRGVASARLAARLERRSIDGVEVWLDVAHNPAGASALAAAFEGELGPGARAHLVFAALADKDIAGILAALAPCAESVACVALDGPRSLAVNDLVDVAREVMPDLLVERFDSVDDARRAVLSRARASGLPVLVAGSFTTVAAFLEADRA